MVGQRKTAWTNHNYNGTIISTSRRVSPKCIIPLINEVINVRGKTKIKFIQKKISLLIQYCLNQKSAFNQNILKFSTYIACWTNIFVSKEL